MDYNGGPVVHSSAPYLVFWDPNGHITARSQEVLKQYLSDAAADSGKATNVFSVLGQYIDSTGSADYRQTFSASQAIVDTHAYPTPTASGCTTTTGYPNCVTDSQIQVELTRLITADSLPTGIGPNAPIYFVITPQDTNICSSGLGCASDGQFCAYHSDFTDGSNDVVYASVPFIVWTVNSTKGCQVDGTSAYQSPNNDPADNVADDLSHELNESITDPLLTAWFNSSGGNEVADNCESYAPSEDPFNGESPNAYEPTLGGSASAGTLYDQVINGDRYYTQTVWSNYDAGCQAQAQTPQFTATARGTTVRFDPTASTQNAGPISSVTWDFGDGSTASSTGSPAVISHTYSLTGTTYTVTLTVVDSFGDVATTRHSVTTDQPPTSAFAGPASGVTGTAVTFDGSGSSDPNSSIAGYAWSFGDGTTSASGPTTSHSYSAPGTYTVALTVTDANGLRSSTSHQITILGLPTASFTGPTAGLAGAAVSFSGSGSSDPDGSIVGYAWSFGDGITSAAGPTTSHTYATSGSYTVTLTVTDSFGLQSTTSHQIAVSAAGLGKLKVSGNTATVTLTCKGASGCSVVLQLSVTKSTRTTKKRVVVGKVTIRLAAGQTRAIQIRLNKTGQRLLGHVHKLKVTLAVVSAGTTVSHATVTFKQTKPPRR